MRATAVAAICVLASGCHPDKEADRNSRSDVEFGIWNPDKNGDLRFVATREVPYVEEQAFGWRMQAAAPERPVKWVETIRLPVAPRSWEGVEGSPNVTISDDGRSATTYGESLPGDAFIGNVWYVSVGDPMGNYELSVEFEDGKKATFRFRMVMPKDGRTPASSGEVI